MDASAQSLASEPRSNEVKDKLESQPAKRPSGWWAAGVALAFLLTAAAWMSMVVSENAGLWCAMAGAVMSVVCICRLRRGLMRDVAITCLIASGVLLVVFALFYFGINLLLESL